MQMSQLLNNFLQRFLTYLLYIHLQKNSFRIATLPLI